MRRFLLFAILAAPMVLFGAEERRGPRPGPGPRPIPLPGPGGPGHGPGHPGGPGIPGLPGNNVALQTAQQLSANLQQLAQTANRGANFAYNQGDYNLYNALRDVSYKSTNLSGEVTRGVVRPLRHGQANYIVKQNLNGMRFELRGIIHTVARLNVGPRIRGAANDVQSSLQQLTQQLNGGFGPGPGPIPIPGPGRLQFKCIAKDRGWEEHIFRPHVGFGPTQFMAQNAALRVCQQSHGRCVIQSCEVVR